MPLVMLQCPSSSMSHARFGCIDVLHHEDYKTRDILCYFQFDRNPIDQNGLLQLFGADSLAKNIDIAIVMAKSYDLMHVEL